MKRLWIAGVGLGLAMGAAMAGAQGAPVKSVRISSGVMAKQIVTQVQPVTPAGVQGAVVLHVIIGKDGTVENLAVVSGPAELHKAAMEAVAQWTYKPFLLNGQPVQVDTTVTCYFDDPPAQL